MVYLATIFQAIGIADKKEREILQLARPHEASVLRVTRIRFDEGDHPVAHESVLLPLSRLPSVGADVDIPDIVELTQRLGLKLGRALERVSIVPACTDVAGHLRFASGTDLLKLDRITETTDGKPIEWRVAFARKPD